MFMLTPPILSTLCLELVKDQKKKKKLGSDSEKRARKFVLQNKQVICTQGALVCGGLYGHKL